MARAEELFSDAGGGVQTAEAEELFSDVAAARAADTRRTESTPAAKARWTTPEGYIAEGDELPTQSEIDLDTLKMWGRRASEGVRNLLPHPDSREASGWARGGIVDAASNLANMILKPHEVASEMISKPALLAVQEAGGPQTLTPEQAQQTKDALRNMVFANTPQEFGERLRNPAQLGVDIYMTGKMLDAPVRGAAKIVAPAARVVGETLLAPAAAAVSKVAEVGAEGAMRAGLKMPLTKAFRLKRDPALKEIFDKKLDLSKESREELDGMINKIDGVKTAHFRDLRRAGEPVGMALVDTAQRAIEEKIAGAGPEGVKAYLEARDVLLDHLRENIAVDEQGRRVVPADVMQEAKMAFADDLRATNYGSEKGASIEARKAIVRGLKEAVAEAHPEFQEINAKESRLLSAKEAIERAANRAENRNPLGLGAMGSGAAGAGAVMAHGGFGPEALLAGAAGATVGHLLESPESLVSNAHRLNRLSKAADPKHLFGRRPEDIKPARAGDLPADQYPAVTEDGRPNPQPRTQDQIMLDLAREKNAQEAAADQAAWRDEQAARAKDHEAAILEDEQRRLFGDREQARGAIERDTAELRAAEQERLARETAEWRLNRDQRDIDRGEARNEIELQELAVENEAARGRERPLDTDRQLRAAPDFESHGAQGNFAWPEDLGELRRMFTDATGEYPHSTLTRGEMQAAIDAARRGETGQPYGEMVDRGAGPVGGPAAPARANPPEFSGGKRLFDRGEPTLEDAIDALGKDDQGNMQMRSGGPTTDEIVRLIDRAIAALPKPRPESSAATLVGGAVLEYNRARQFAESGERFKAREALLRARSAEQQARDATLRQGESAGRGSWATPERRLFGPPGEARVAPQGRNGRPRYTGENRTTTVREYPDRPGEAVDPAELRDKYRGWMKALLKGGESPGREVIGRGQEEGWQGLRVQVGGQAGGGEHPPPAGPALTASRGGGITEPTKEATNALRSDEATAPGAPGRVGEEPVRLFDRPGEATSPEAAAEQRVQERILRENQPQQQTIVTIADAFNWLDQRGLQPKIKTTPATAFAKLLKHPDFWKENIFDRARLAAQLERTWRENVYAESAGITGQNRKTSGSNVLSADTVRGCDQFCIGCYAKGGADQGATSHQTPMLTKIKGIVRKEELLRIGTVGEPAKNWRWTAEQVQEAIDRSRRAGHDVSPEKNVYFITKLLNLEGFDPSVIRNLEISIDPIYPAHMRQTMANVVRLITDHPEVNIALRIRSLRSKNPQMQAALQAAVDFANELNLPVLETKMRFKSKAALDILELDKDSYHRAGPQYKANGQMLREEVNRGKWKQCDESGTGKCSACLNCARLMVGEAEKGILDRHVGERERRLFGSESERLDPRGDVPDFYRGKEEVRLRKAHAEKRFSPGPGGPR